MLLGRIIARHRRIVKGCMRDTVADRPVPSCRAAPDRRALQWAHQRGTRHLSLRQLRSAGGNDSSLRLAVQSPHSPESPGACPAHRGMKRWYAEKPELFIKVPRNRPGPDNYTS